MIAFHTFSAEILKNNKPLYFNKKIFDCVNKIAQAEHRSKIEVRHLLIEKGTKSYVCQKTKSDSLAESIVGRKDRRLSAKEELTGVAEIAHLERRPKSETERFLLEEGIKYYTRLTK